MANLLFAPENLTRSGLKTPEGVSLHAGWYKIIGSLFQSLDGVIQAPGGPEEDQTGFAHGGWVFPYFDDTLEEPMGRLPGGSYERLLGRRTYEIFAAYWPHNGDQPIGETFNAVRKHVVTSSDRSLTWNNSQRLLGDPAEAVARLKASDGPDLLIQGSSMLYQALLPAGLVDQLAFDHLPGHAWPRQALVFGLPATARSWTLVEQAHSPKGVHFASFARGEEVRTGSFATKPPNSRSVSVKRRVVGEPAALRSPIQQLHVEGADRAMGGRDPVRVPYAWPRSPRERRRATPPLAVRTIPAAG